MARRTFDVIDICEIFVHWHAGRSKNEVAGSLGLSRNTVRKYVAILLEASDARRSDLGLLGDCSAFRVIPPGSRVTPGTNNTGLLHAAVGPPGMDRILTPPIAGVSTIPELEAAVAQLGTDWLITPTGEPIGVIAAGDPGVFESHGTMCDGATLWRVVKG